jgi:hypothetical protein
MKPIKCFLGYTTAQSSSKHRVWGSNPKKETTTFYVEKTTLSYNIVAKDQNVSSIVDL